MHNMSSGEDESGEDCEKQLTIMEPLRSIMQTIIKHDIPTMVSANENLAILAFLLPIEDSKLTDCEQRALITLIEAHYKQLNSLGEQLAYLKAAHYRMKEMRK